MDPQILLMILTVLSLALAGCLFWILKLFLFIRALPIRAERELHVPTDRMIGYFEGMFLSDKSEMSVKDFAGKPVVYTFLSSRCKECLSKIPQIKSMIPAMKASGVELAVVAMEKPWRSRRFFKKHGLLEYAIHIEDKYKPEVNPSGASPFYVFVDDEAMPQASNFIGDENWQSFVGQMDDIASSLKETDKTAGNEAA